MRIVYQSTQTLTQTLSERPHSLAYTILSEYPRGSVFLFGVCLGRIHDDLTETDDLLRIQGSSHVGVVSRTSRGGSRLRGCHPTILDLAWGCHD